VAAPVVFTVETYLGLPAYARDDWLSGLIGEDWAANALLGRTSGGGVPERFLEQIKRRPDVIGLSRRERSLTLMRETFGEMMNVSITVLVLFAGLIAFGSVLNSTLVSLSEREREAATLRVLGYTPVQVAGIFSGESYLLNLVGVAVGLVGGVALARLISRLYDTELYRFPAVLYPSRFVLAAGLMILFVTVAQVLVYRLIRKLPWLDIVKTRE
jgi:putative ABC transport system permease protein